MSSIPNIRLPLPSAVKLPVRRKKGLATVGEVNFPLKENAYGPCKTALPKVSVTVTDIVCVESTWDTAVMVMVPPAGGISGAL